MSAWTGILSTFRPVPWSFPWKGRVKTLPVYILTSCGILAKTRSISMWSTLTSYSACLKIQARWFYFVVHFILVQSVAGWGCNSHGKESLDYPPHHICSHSSSEHDQLLYKLLQTFLFWSLSDCEPHSYAGPYNLIYQCKCPSFTDLYHIVLNL